MLRTATIALLLLGTASPVMAIQSADGFKTIEDFETYPLGPRSFVYSDVPNGVTDELGVLSGGEIEAGSPAFPAFSGDHVYAGTSITLDIADALNYSWPAAWAYVSGTAPIVFRAYEYDADLAANTLIYEFITAGNDSNSWIGFGSSFDPQFLTRVTFTSDARFAIDNLEMGLVDVGPGVPEPGSWMLLIAGFGLTGTALRRRVSVPRSSTPTG
jgi:hypothetical protein